MNFLITGAAGFLGSSLANQLAREGHQIRGLDDLSAGEDLLQLRRRVVREEMPRHADAVVPAVDRPATATTASA